MDKTSLVLMIGGISFLIMLVMLWKLDHEQKQKEELRLFKEMYEKAIRDGNREAAYEYGRQYYTKLNHGELSVEDEVTIIRELPPLPEDMDT